MQLINRNKYVINKKAANDTLKNVFEACELEPNTKPLELIEVWTIANATIVKIGMWLSVALLIGVLVMPLAFVGCVEKDNGLVTNDRVEISNHYLDEEHGYFVMVIDGEIVDYNSVYAVDSNGGTIFPVEINEDEHTVKIPFKEGNLNIFIPKTDGTFVQAILSK